MTVCFKYALFVMIASRDLTAWRSALGWSKNRQVKITRYKKGCQLAPLFTTFFD
jgi:hypothetical protein